MKRVLITVTGKVQGVGFRKATLFKARQLGLTGYVTNLANKQVEILAQGSVPVVDQLLEWCHYGVRDAVVDQVVVENDEADEIYLDFSIIQA